MTDQISTVETVQEERALDFLRRLDFDWCVRLRGVWTDKRVDVNSLHSRLREEFQQKLQDLKADANATTLGWPIVGVGGTGKTHLLGQLRKYTIQQESTFVLVDMTDVRDFWDTVLQGYVDSLQEFVGEETQQFVILRRFLKNYFKGPVDRTLKRLTDCSVVQLTKYIQKILHFLQRKKGQLAVKHQDAIRAIVCLNSEDFDVQSVGLSWLQGQVLDEEWRKKLGFRVAQQSPRQTVMSLSWYLSLVGPTVIGFDQLDPIVHQIRFASTEDSAESCAAQGIVQRIASGLADLRELHRTFTVITCVESTWSLLPKCAMSTALDRFEPVRVLGNAGSSSFVESLIAGRVASAAADTDWKPPFPTWPFESSALSMLATETPRVVLKKCDEQRRAMLRQNKTWQVQNFTAPTHLAANTQNSSQPPAVDETLDKIAEQPSGDDISAQNDLDERFEHLMTGVDLSWLLDHSAEDDRLAPLYVTAFDCLLTEQAHRIPESVDCVLDCDFSGKQNARPLHARLRLVFHDQNSREEHYCVRGLESKHARSYQARLKAAITTSGIDRALKFRNLAILRTTDVPGGEKTAELTNGFYEHGGKLYAIPEASLLTLHALRHMREENDPAFDDWLRIRKPVSGLQNLLEVLVPNSLFVSGADEKTETIDDQLDSSFNEASDAPDSTSSLSDETNSPTMAKTDDTTVDSQLAFELADPAQQPVGKNSEVLLPLGSTVSAYGGNETIAIPAQDLAKHALVIGASGSGKTTTVRRIVEEAALAGIPSIIIDCASDLCTFDEHRNEPSKYWNDDDPGKSRQFKQTTRQVVYTPGKSSGRPLSLEPIPDLIPLRDDPDALQSAVSMMHGALLEYVTSGKSQRARNKAGILANSLDFFAKHAPVTNLQSYIHLLEDLPVQAQLEIARETDLAKQMADSLKIQIAQNPLLRGDGTPLDPAVLFGDHDDDPRTTISAISLIGLSTPSQQQSFINQLSMLLFSWIKKNPHPPNGRALRGLLIIDEAKDFVPAIKSTSCKDSLRRLLAQARKYNLGVVLATQNPKDVDTKIVGNCGTQLFGRVISPASLETAIEMLRAQGLESAKLSENTKGKFYVCLPEKRLPKPTLVQMPDSLTAGRLLTEEEILKKSRQTNDPQ